MQEIAEKIFFMPGRNNGAFPFCNSIYIEDETRAIIDPASNKKDIAELKNVSLAVLSHFHMDHLRELRVLGEVKVAIHESEAFVLDDLNNIVGLIFLPGEDEQEKKELVESKKRELQVEHRSWTVDRRLKDGDEINLGGTKVRAVHTPGHTVGLCCFWLPGPEILYSSDIDLTGFGPWYGNACSDVGQFLESLEKLKAFKPKLVVTGHEAGLVPGGEFHERLVKFSEKILEREQKVLDALDRPKTLDQVVSLGIIYGEFLQKMPGLRTPEMRMIFHHLRRLERMGKIIYDSGRWTRNSRP
jgi:hydroxyacylglutathione hydrolase